MKINTLLFGEIDIDDQSVITFDAGLPGFEALRRFALISPEETRPLLWLQSLEEPNVALSVVNTFDILPDYALDVRDEEIDALGVKGLEELLVLTVVVVPEEIAKMTGNLAAPLFINTRLNKGKQVIAEGELPVRHPIFADICLAEKRREQLVGADAKG